MLRTVDQGLAICLTGHVADDNRGAMQIGPEFQVGGRLLVALKRQVARASILSIVSRELDHVGDHKQCLFGILAGSAGELIKRDILDGGHDG